MVKTTKTKGAPVTKMKNVKIHPTVQALYDRTVAWGEMHGVLPEGVKSKKVDLSKKAKIVSKILDEMDLGCKEKHTRNLMSALLEEKLPVKDEHKPPMHFHGGIVLIPKSRAALTSNADIGIPYLITNTRGSAISIVDGERVDTEFITSAVDDHIELATVSDIKHLLDDFGAKGGDDWVGAILNLLHTK